MKLSYLPWESPAAGSERVCLRDAQRALSYAEVESRAAAFAEQLLEHGIVDGDVVAVMLPNSLELVIALFGAWRVGAAATPVNPTFTERERRYQLDDAGAKLLLTQRGSVADGIDLEATVLFDEALREGCV